MGTIYIIELHRGSRANRPATGNPGEPYFCLDTGELFIWNGSRWVEITAYAGSVSVADLASVEGNGTKVQLTNQGATTAGDVVTYDGLGNVQDSGVLLSSLVLNTTTVNSHALSSNVVISASDLTTGTLPHAQLPALVSGDIPNNAANTTGTAGGLSANIAESQVTNLVTDLAGKVPTTTTVNSHALSGNITLALSDFGGTVAIGQTPLTTLGDLLVVNSTPALARLAGNTTTTRNFLRQTGNGTISALPVWDTLIAGDIPNIAESQVTNLTTDLGNKVSTSTTVNGHALSGNIVISASDLTTGTLPHAQLPTLLSADIPNNSANTTGSAASLSAASALPNNTTATTQATSDNSTNVATTAYVNNYRAANPMTTLGDTDYGGASGAETRLVGNTTTTRKFLRQTGTGSVSAAPAWDTIIAADVPTLNQNTAGTAGGLSGTPAITVASVNGLTISTSTGTFTLTNGKTLTVDNSLEFAGTDSTKLTFQGTGTVVNRDSTDTLTNKTFDTAGTGNVFKINGTQVSAVTGSGSSVLATSPTIATPTITGTASLASASLSGTVTSYDGFSTAGVGIGSIVATYDATTQGANISSQNLITSGNMTANIKVRITAMWQVTRAASGGSPSSTLPTFNLTWTDNDSTASQTQAVAPSNTLYAGAGGVATGNTTTTRGHAIISCNCQSGTALSFTTTAFATAGTTSMQYAIHIIVERIG